MGSAIFIFPPCFHFPLKGHAFNRIFVLNYLLIFGFPVSSVGKESTCNAGDSGSIPRLGRSAGEGIGYHQPREHIKKQRHYFANKDPSSQSYGFSSSHVWM